MLAELTRAFCLTSSNFFEHIGIKEPIRGLTLTPRKIKGDGSKEVVKTGGCKDTRDHKTLVLKRVMVRVSLLTISSS